MSLHTITFDTTPHEYFTCTWQMAVDLVPYRPPTYTDPPEGGPEQASDPELVAVSAEIFDDGKWKDAVLSRNVHPQTWAMLSEEQCQPEQHEIDQAIADFCEDKDGEYEAALEAASEAAWERRVNNP